MKKNRYIIIPFLVIIVTFLYLILFLQIKNTVK